MQCRSLFVVTTIYRGADANAMRYRLSSESLDELGKADLNYYANQTPSIQLDGAHQVSDDQNANTITVTERYIIEESLERAKALLLRGSDLRSVSQTHGGEAVNAIRNCASDID